MAKNVERLQAREANELIRREKQLGGKRSIGGTLVDLPIFLDN